MRIAEQKLIQRGKEKQSHKFILVLFLQCTKFTVRDSEDFGLRFQRAIVVYAFLEGCIKAEGLS